MARILNVFIYIVVQKQSRHSMVHFLLIQNLLYITLYGLNSPPSPHTHPPTPPLNPQDHYSLAYWVDGRLHQAWVFVGWTASWLIIPETEYTVCFIWMDLSYNMLYLSTRYVQRNDIPLTAAQCKSPLNNINFLTAFQDEDKIVEGSQGHPLKYITKKSHIFCF